MFNGYTKMRLWMHCTYWTHFRHSPDALDTDARDAFYNCPNMSTKPFHSGMTKYITGLSGLTVAIVDITGR